MRLLHLSDTHLGMSGARGALARIAADAFARALARAQGVDLVVHSGDLFDRSRPPETAVRFAWELLARVAKDVPVLIIAGNHDRRGLFGALGDPPPGVTLVDTARIVPFGGLRLACVPHTPQADHWSAQARELSRQGADLWVAHNAFDGVRVPKFTFRVGRPPETVGAAGLPPGVRHVLCGHLHPRQTVMVGSATIVCAGSTVRTGFREGAPPKGTVRWDLGARVTYAFEPLTTPDWVLVQKEADLAPVCDGTVVRLGRDAPPELAEVAASRGALLLTADVPDPPDLFGPRAAPPPE